MQDTKKRPAFATLAGLTLCVTLAAQLTLAQGQNGQGGQSSNQGFGNRGFGRQGRNGQGTGGGRGGFGGQMPFAMGTITAGDANMHQITIQSQFGGSAQTIQLGTTTQLVTQQTVSITDLKIDDQIQVQGMPTGITASSITAGQMPSFLQGGGQTRFGGEPPSNNAPDGAGSNGSGGGQAANARTAFASATGRITSLAPLTISLGEGVSLTVKTGAKARVSRIASLSFNSLKVGDRVMAAGQAGNDGVFAATGIAVNMTMGGGPGGPPPGGGGRGGPGGQDGQDGPPPEGGTLNGANN